MAKRSNQLSEKLGSSNQPQGWQDQIKTGQPEPEPEKPVTKTSTYVRKTYLMTQDLIDRIQAVSDQENVGQNELVRYLMDLALQQVEQGTHELPTRPGRNTLGM